MGRWHLNYFRTIHSIKTAIGCLIGVFIDKYYDLPSGQWIPITVMVVMSAQVHFGGALRKAYLRFLGTVAGIASTVVVLYLFGNSLEVVLIASFIFCLLFTYVASSVENISYAGTLGGVTMLLTLTGQQASIDMAIQRGFYILLGIAIALLVSRFIFPIHACDRFRVHVATTLRNLCKLYKKVVEMDFDLKQKNIDAKLDAIVAHDISSDQLQLIAEASSGHIKFTNNKHLFEQLVDSEHKINRLINLMYMDLCENQAKQSIKEYLDSFGDAHEIIGNTLVYLADCFENMTIPKATSDVNDEVNKIAQRIEKFTKNNELEDIVVNCSFMFFIGQILKELENTRELITKVNSNNHNDMI